MDVQNPIEFENGLINGEKEGIIGGRLLDVAVKFDTTKSEVLQAELDDFPRILILRMKRGQAGRVGEMLNEASCKNSFR
jgi:hypothetical protein